MTALSTAETATLSPSYKLPLVIIAGAVPLAFVQIWLAGVIALFGVFLLYQAATLRLTFTQTDLDIYRGDTQIRRFPYQEWQRWDIFWPPVPVLFYFREVNSIHFLPILFAPHELRSQLEQHIQPE